MPAAAQDPVLPAIQALHAKALAARSSGVSPDAAGSTGAAAGGGVGLVVDGGALVALLQPAREDEFLELAKACDAVICCRVSPMQKAQVCGGCVGVWGGGGGC
jgi:magnesium-transporting ATPase (P-type)